MLRNTPNSIEYQLFDKQYYSNYRRKTIDGKIVGCSKCVGYCDYEGHPGFLTDKLRKAHSCCEKDCYYYIQKPQRDRHNELGRKSDEELLKSFMDAAKTATIDYEGMRVINVSNYDNNSCVLRYATISNSYPIKEIEQSLTDVLGISVRLDKIICDFDKAVNLIFSD